MRQEVEIFRKKIIALVYFLCCSSYLKAQNDTLVFYPVNNPVLSQYDIRKITVGKDGKLWLSADKGVIRFDGNEILFFGKGNGGNMIMDNQSISRTCFDKAGNLYCVIVWGKIYYLNTKTGKVDYINIHVPSEDSSHFNKVYPYTEIFADTEYLWGARHNMGFIGYNLTSKTTTVYNLPSAKTENKNGVNCIQKDRKNYDILWLGTNNGIYSFNKKTHEFKRNFACSIPSDSSASDIEIFDMHAKNENEIWFTASATGVGCYNIRTGLYTIYPLKKQTNTTSAAKDILIFFQPRNDFEYYVGSSRACPAIFNTRTHQYTFNIKTYQAYPGLNINHIATDSAGNLWCIIFGKLYLAASKKHSLTTLALQNGDKKNQLTNIFKTVVWDDKKKNYYAAFDNCDAVFVLDSNIHFVKSIPFVSINKNKQEIKEVNVYDIVLDQQGRLWGCGSDLWMYDSRSEKMLPAATLHSKFRFGTHSFQNIVLRNKHLYLQPSDKSCGVFYRIDTDNFSYDSILIPGEIFKNKTVTFENEKNLDVLAVDKSERYAYVAVHNTVIQLNLKTRKARHVTTVNTKEFQHFFNMSWYLLDDEDRLWVSSIDGIVIFDQDNLKPVKRIYHPAGTYRLQFYNIAEKGIMCVLYSEGIVLYDYKNSAQYQVSLNDGLITFFNSSVAGIHNILFSGAELNALQYISLDAVIKKNPPRNCYLSSIQLFGNPFYTDSIPEYLKSLTLPYNKNFLTFTFSSTEFEQPERLAYTYKLTGVNENWIQTNFSNRTITYNNLLPGSYYLYFSVIQRDGTWNNNNSALHIIITPAWWQTNWFKIACIIATSILAFMLIKWRINTVRKQEQEKARIEKEILELEAKALRAQMNPHFIFNCMNSIKSLIQKDENEKAINYLTTFSKLIRTIFQNSDKREVTLFDEIETCRLYTQLESLRFNNKFSYAFYIDETLDLKSTMVPALIIQPFIENAIWHGIMPKTKGGRIGVTVSKQQEKIYCIVDDDGIGRQLSLQNKITSTTVAHQSKGVRLTQTRLELSNMLNRRNATFETIDKVNDRGEPDGTKVILTFNEE